MPEKCAEREIFGQEVRSRNGNFFKKFSDMAQFGMPNEANIDPIVSEHF
jgi:hypothetical protein